MNDAPERIWIRYHEDEEENYWLEWIAPREAGEGCDVEYIRADLLEAQAALIAEARRMIRDLSDTLGLRLEEAVTYDECQADIDRATAFLNKLDNA